MRERTRPVIPTQGIFKKRDSIRFKKQEMARRFTRRAVLAGGISGLALLQTAPVSALVRSSTQAASTSTTLGQTLYKYTALPSGIYSIAWSPNGNRVVVSGLDDVGRNVGQTWDALTGANVVTFAADGDPYGHFVYSGEWSPDGTRIASGTNDQAMIWDAASGETLVHYTGHQSSWVNVVEWSPDGKRCASAALDVGVADYAVQVWDASSADQLLTYSGHTGEVNSVSWSPDGRYLASGSSDHTVQIWDASSAALITTYTGHTNIVSAVKWSPDGTRIASGGVDATVQIWSPFTGQGYLTYHGHIASVSAVSWSPDGTTMASCSEDRSVQLWHSNSTQTLYYYYGNGSLGAVTDVSWSPNGQLIAESTLTGHGLFAPTESQALIWVG